jgi:hypothetical protein
MSTIYVFNAELSTMDTLASTDKFLVYDASSGRSVTATPSDVQTYVSANLSAPAIVNGGSWAGNASFSILIGTTLSSRVGFYGVAGTSQPASAAQGAVTCTVLNPTTASSVIGFSTTAAMQDVLSLIIQMRATLVANGLMKGAA